MLMGGTVELQGADGTRRAANVQLLGVPVGFWELELRAWRPKAALVGDQAVLNAAVAEELGARLGDRVVLFNALLLILGEFHTVHPGHIDPRRRRPDTRSARKRCS